MLGLEMLAQAAHLGGAVVAVGAGVADFEVFGVLVYLEVAPRGGLVLALVAGELDLLVDGPLVQVQAAHLRVGRDGLYQRVAEAAHF